MRVDVRVPPAAAFDPVRRRARSVAEALRARRRARPLQAAAAVLAGVLAVCAALIAGGTALVHAGAPLSAVLHRHPVATACLAALLMGASARSTALRRAQRWRSGWLGALPQTAACLPAALLRGGARDGLRGLAVSVAAVTLWRILDPSLALPAGPLVAIALLALACPLLAAFHAGRRAGAMVTPAGMAAQQDVPRAGPRRLARRLPVAAAFQLLGALQGWRGRGLWWRVAPALLLLPAGMGAATLLPVLLLILLAIAVLALWLRSMACVLDASTLLRALPQGPGRRPCAWLALPAAALGTYALGVAVVLASGGQPVAAGGVLVAVAAAAALHAGCAFASARDGRPLSARLAVHAALPAATWQALPPLLPLVVLLQLAWLWRRARRA